ARAPGTVREVQSQVGDRDVIIIDLRLSFLDAPILTGPQVRLKQEMAAGRVRVIEDRVVLRTVMVRRGGLGREDGTHLLQDRKYTLAGWVLGVRQIYFVFRCHLPRKADRVVGRVITVVGAPGEVRFIEQRVLQLVIVVAHLIYGPVVSPERGKEPQFVLFDRAAKRSSNVIVLFDRRRSLQAAGAQLIAHVVADQAGACGLDARRSRELVAAVLGYDVDLDSTGRRLGGTGSRLDDDLLECVCVILEPAAAGHSVIHAGNVVSHIVGPLAMNAEKAAVTSDSADIVEVCASRISRRG